jgi:hypothetical protein
VSAATILSGCQLDIGVDVAIERDGSGTIEVRAEADAALVARLPELADQLIFDDLTDWTATGPSPTPDDGLTVTLNTTFANLDEMAQRLAEIGPPISQMRAGQAVDADMTLTTTAIAGVLEFPDSFAAFADDELIELVGGIPFADQLQGVLPAEVMRVEFQVSMPGEVIDSNGREVSAGVFVWEAPSDSTALAVAASSVVRDSEPPGWARPVATLALLGLIIWALLSLLFIGFVVAARRRKRSQRRRPPPRRTRPAT